MNTLVILCRYISTLKQTTHTSQVHVENWSKKRDIQKEKNEIIKKNERNDMSENLLIYLVILIIWIMCYHFQLNAHSARPIVHPQEGHYANNTFRLFVLFVHCSLTRFHWSARHASTLYFWYTSLFFIFQSMDSLENLPQVIHVEYNHTHMKDIHELSPALLLLYEVSKCEQLEISHFFSPLLLRLCADHPSQLKNPVAWHSNYHTGKILIVGNQRTPRKKESYRPAAISSEHSWSEWKSQPSTLYKFSLVFYLVARRH